MGLCNRVKEMRLDKGLTQEALAFEAGVTRQTIIAIERGKFGPSVRLALKLASTLGTTVEELFWLQETEGAEE